MSAAVLDSHPTLTAVLFGLYEQEPGVFMPISFEDRLTAVNILADRLDPPALAPHLVSNTQWFLPATPVVYEEVAVLPFTPPRPELLEFLKTFTIVTERYFDENEDVELFGIGEPLCHSVQPSPGPSNTASSTPGLCAHGISLAFRCGHCLLEGKQK